MNQTTILTIIQLLGGLVIALGTSGLIPVPQVVLDLFNNPTVIQDLINTIFAIIGIFGATTSTVKLDKLNKSVVVDGEVSTQSIGKLSNNPFRLS